MTVTREAIVLPASFLTVALLGGLRLAPQASTFGWSRRRSSSLVLAVLLLGSLVRSRVFAAETVSSRIIAHRLENAIRWRWCC